MAVNQVYFNRGEFKHPGYFNEFSWTYDGPYTLQKVNQSLMSGSSFGFSMKGRAKLAKVLSKYRCKKPGRPRTHPGRPKGKKVMKRRCRKVGGRKTVRKTAGRRMSNQ